MTYDALGGGSEPDRSLVLKILAALSYLTQLALFASAFAFNGLGETQIRNDLFISWAVVFVLTCFLLFVARPSFRIVAGLILLNAVVALVAQYSAAASVSSTSAPSFRPTTLAPSRSPSASPTCPYTTCSGVCCLIGEYCQSGTCHILCFSAGSVLNVRSPEGRVTPTRLAEVRLGDEVETADPVTGLVKWEPVLLFGKVDRKKTCRPVRIQAGNSTELLLTRNHILWASASASSALREMLARDVQPGYWILARAKGEPGEQLEMLQVTGNSEDVAVTGLLAPHTASGTILVNGVVASCHAVRAAWWRQLVMSPVLWLYGRFGIPGAGRLPEDGSHPWVSGTNSILGWTVGPEFGMVGRPEGLDPSYGALVAVS